MAMRLSQIEAQIKKLQAEAASLRQKEVAGVVARIREAIREYGLTADQLFGSPAPKKKGPKPAAEKPAKRRAKAGKVAIKYRDGENTWTGRGNKPRWLTARLAAGEKIEDFVVGQVG